MPLPDPTNLTNFKTSGTVKIQECTYYFEEKLNVGKGGKRFYIITEPVTNQLKLKLGPGKNSLFSGSESLSK